MEFKVLKKSKKSNARLGVLKTAYGEVETPAIVPVATQGAVKALMTEDVERTGTQLLIANTFHLHLKPGEDIVEDNGGLHKFMNWKRPLMTDSGGFQVFSLGFGREHGMGKILKRDANLANLPAGRQVYPNAPNGLIGLGQQPKLLKISDEGVIFTSPVDGRKVFLNPTKSVRIQEALGADIIFAFDECTSPIADHAYTKKSLERTHRWAVESLEAKNSKLQAIYGIVQGGKFKDLRQESAKFISSLPFDGFGIGGEFGDEKRIMTDMLGWVLKELPENKPRHLLGIGYLEDIKNIIKSGVDTFDCIVPTRFARHGTAFIRQGRDFASTGKLDIGRGALLKDKKPLDPKCGCDVCKNYSRSYIAHLFKAKEISALSLLTFHNLYFFNDYVATLRKEIKAGKL